MNRLSWTDYFKEIVSVVAKRSVCSRLQVGTILVKDNRIIAMGYNGFLAGCEHRSIIRDNHEIATIHSETNAITDCAIRGQSTLDTTVYITHYPCLNCTKLLLSSGIKEIYYINDYNNDPLVAHFCNLKCVPIKKLD